MRYQYIIALAAFAAIISIAGSTAVSITEPVVMSINNSSSVYLGKVGPGQTFYVNITSSAYTSSGNYLNIGWNEFVVKKAPPGWTIQNSSLNTIDLSVLIKPAPDTPTGRYPITFEAVNIGNYSGLGTLTFTGYINVTPDVFKLQANPAVLQANAGSTSDILVSINNTGVSDNPFLITLTGLPAWNQTETAIALHHTSRTFTYGINEYIPGVYKTALLVQSISSPIVYKETNITIVVERNPISDYTAIGGGTITFPIIYEPALAIMYIIGEAIKHL
jgi:hypothetical protein